MAVPSDELDLNLEASASALESKGCAIKKRDEMMIVAEWCGMEATVYPIGKIMFFPLKDKAACIRHALDILEIIK